MAWAYGFTQPKERILVSKETLHLVMDDLVHYPFIYL